MKNEKSEKFLKLCEKYGVDDSNVPEILSYDDACRVLKKDVKKKRNPLEKTMIVVAAFAKKSGFKADYKNKAQDRYYPVFDMTSAGLVFCRTSYEDWISRSNAGVGAPFVFANRDQAEFVAKHFLALYRGWMTTTNFVK